MIFSFGKTVAISGDYAVVGAPQEDTRFIFNRGNETETNGAVYIYQRQKSVKNGVTVTQWNQIDKLTVNTKT